ncbi:DUF4184 family protein [Clostridium perfringens]|nr:DUF4184 family protein [Clostridium perfringens]
MPFTLAHPAAVLCLKNKRFNFTALVLGSMAPDFLYFLNFRPYGNLGHEILGFFILNLPLCILLAYVFHNFIKSPLISHLPRPFDGWYGYLRTEQFGLHSWREGLVFIYSALLGMVTHIIWDAFTHKTGFFVEHISFLQKKVLTLGGYNIYGYSLLQHGSTLVGIIIVLWFLYKIRDNRNRILWGHKRFNDKLIYHLIVVCATIIVLFLSYSVSRYFNISYGVGNLVVAIINGIFIGIIIATFKN